MAVHWSLPRGLDLVVGPLSSASSIGEVSFYSEHLVPSSVLLYLPVKLLPTLLLPFDFLVVLLGPGTHYVAQASDLLGSSSLMCWAYRWELMPGSTFSYV